jgi:hypothetical protein
MQPLQKAKAKESSLDLLACLNFELENYLLEGFS